MICSFESSAKQSAKLFGAALCGSGGFGFLAATALSIVVTGGPAKAADMPSKAPVYKAPPAVLYNWTGFYVGGGFGCGMFNLDSSLRVNGSVESDNITNAGRGLLGTVGLGFDYQFTNRIVVGAFADWDFSDIKGRAPG